MIVMDVDPVRQDGPGFRTFANIAKAWDLDGGEQTRSLDIHAAISSTRERAVFRDRRDRSRAPPVSDEAHGMLLDSGSAVSSDRDGEQYDTASPMKTMFQRFADWLRRMEAAWATASRSDFEILASDRTELREKVRRLEATD